MQKTLALVLLLLSYISATSQELDPLLVPNDLTNQKVWVDSVYNNMSIQEKVGQLLSLIHI